MACSPEPVLAEAGAGVTKNIVLPGRAEREPGNQMAYKIEMPVGLILRCLRQEKTGNDISIITAIWIPD